MSTPTPTQAHYDLRREIIHSAPDDGAQLIADSEARAVTKQVEALEIIVLRWHKLEKEQDQLRAELATERARLDWLEQRGPWESWVKSVEEGLTLRAPVRAAIDAAMKEGA